MGGGVKLPSIYSKFVYKTLLNNGYLQSVRDEFTANQLRRIGIKNVINTNCVTLWGLDKSCRNIPAYKSNCVVFTVTGYMKDKQFDIFMVELLTRLYDTVYFWPQGDADLDYLKSICNLDGINVLDRTLEAYETALTRDSIDYVGSRLHGGIYALHHCKRTIIIAVDNRAWKMHLDTNLPVIKSSDAKLKLEQLILTNWKTEIHLNTQAMEQWKEELRKSIAAE